MKNKNTLTSITPIGYLNQISLSKPDQNIEKSCCSLIDWQQQFFDSPNIRLSRRAMMTTPALGAVALSLSPGVVSASEEIRRERLFVDRASTTGPVDIRLLSERARLENGSISRGSATTLSGQDGDDSLWRIDPAAFGPEAQIEFKLTARRQEIRAPRLIVRISKVRYGRRDDGELIIRLYRKERPDTLVNPSKPDELFTHDNRAWYISARARIFTLIGWLDFGVPGAFGEHLRLKTFMGNTAPGNPASAALLQAETTQPRLKHALRRIFSGLADMNPDLRKERTFISFDKYFVWKVWNGSADLADAASTPESKKRAFEMVVPGNYSQGFVACIARDDNEERPRFVAVAMSSANLVDANDDHAALRQINQQGLKKTGELGLHSDIVMSHAGSYRFVVKPQTLDPKSGKPTRSLTVLQVYDLDPIRGSKQLDVRTEGVIVGRWQAELLSRKDGDKRSSFGLSLGPMRSLEGVLKRRVDLPLRDLRVLTRENAVPNAQKAKFKVGRTVFPVEETSFSATVVSGKDGNSIGLSADEQAFETPVGWIEVAAKAPPPEVRRQSADGEAGETLLRYFEEPFQDFSSSPIWMISSGSAFDLAKDPARTIDWFEANWHLRECAIPLQGTDRSRLQFENSELSMVFNPDPKGGQGRNYIWLGPNEAGEPKAAPERARFDLSRAKLDVARNLDLARMGFRFDGLYLLHGKTTRLVPEGPLCGVFAEQAEISRGVFDARRTGSQSPGGKPDGDDRLPVWPVRDSRPRLIVDLPPQHIMEQAFFQRRLGRLPDLDYSLLAEIESLLPKKEGDSSPWSGDNAPWILKFTISGRVESLDLRDPQEVIDLLDALPTAGERAKLRNAVAARKSQCIKEKICSSSNDNKCKEGDNKCSNCKILVKRFNAQVCDFVEFCKRFKTECRGGFSNLPPDQAIYIGAYAMDPFAAGFARSLRNRIESEQSINLLANVFQFVSSQRELVIKRVEYDPTVQSAALREALSRYNAGAPGKDTTRRDLLALDDYLAASSPTYLLFRQHFRDRILDEHADDPAVADRSILILPEFENFTPANSEFKLKELPGDFGTSDDRRLMEADFRAAVTSFVDQQSGIEALVAPAEARLSKASRLAFSVNCRDQLVDQRDAANARRDIDPRDTHADVRGHDGYDPSNPFGPGVDSIPFTLSALTNWSSMEMAVTPRAEAVFAPAPGGRLDQNSARRLNLHGAAKLDHLGFQPSDDPASQTWARRAEAIVHSMRNPPGANETEIIIPSRLSLSPSQQALFLAPGGINTAIFDGGGQVRSEEPLTIDEFGRPVTRATEPLLSSSEAALWAVELMTDGGAPDAGLRAIHSPDVAPDALLKLFAPKHVQDRPSDDNADSNMADETETQLVPDGSSQPTGPGYGAPPRGALAPWFLSRAETFRTDQSPSEFWRQTFDGDAQRFLSKDDGRPKYPSTNGKPDHPDDEAVCTALDGQEGAYASFVNLLPSRLAELCRRYTKRSKSSTQLKFRTSLDAYDRHEIVMLSSAFGMAVMPNSGRKERTVGVEQASQFVPDEDYTLIDVYPEQEVYRPRALDVSQLSLTALGGTFVHDTSFSPPASAKFFDGRNLFDAFSVERWQHVTHLGRDVHVEVVYKGYLYPFGMPASLVKVTERIIAPDESGGEENLCPDDGAGTRKRPRYTAFLQQRMFIRCAEPTKQFAAIGQPFRGRGFPCRSVTLLTTVTPDIIDPTTVFEENKETFAKEAANGRILFKSEPGLVFWPRTSLSARGDIEFELMFDENHTKGRLLFVDNVAANDPTTLGRLAEYYTNNSNVGVKSPDVDRATTLIEPHIHRRTFVFGGAKVRYGDEHKTGDASMTTHAITLRVEGRSDSDSPTAEKIGGVQGYKLSNNRYVFDPALQAANQPPFYPAIQTIRCILEDNARLTGNPPKVRRAMFDGHYLVNGFPARPERASDATITVPEIFLNLLDGEPQAMGNRGDQSGGIFRPSGTLRAIARDKGPLAHKIELSSFEYSNGQPHPSLALEFEDQSATAIKTVQKQGRISGRSANKAPLPTKREELLGKVFGDAKLLGIIEFKEIIKFIVKSDLFNSNGIPELKETVDYGIARLEEAGDAVGQGVETLGDYARRSVLTPLSDLIEEALERWHALDRQLIARQTNRVASATDIQPVTLEEIFPEIDDSLIEFQRTIDSAIKATSELDLILQLAAVFEAGQRFLNILRKVASEAVERFETSLERRVKSVSAKIDEFKTFIDNGIDALRAMIQDDLPERIAKEVVGLFFPESSSSPDALFHVQVPLVSWNAIPWPNEEFREQAIEEFQEILTFRKAEVEDIVEAAFQGIVSNSEAKLAAQINELLEDKRNKLFGAIDKYAGAVFDEIKDEEVVKEIYRLKVELTEYHAIAKELLKDDGIQLVVQIVKGEEDVTKLRKHVEGLVGTAISELLKDVKKQIAALESEVREDLKDLQRDVLEEAEDRLENAKNEAKRRMDRVADQVLSEVEPLALYLLEARTRFEALKNAVDRGDIASTLFRSEDLASHLFQRKMAFVEEIQSELEDIPDRVANTIDQLDIGALELLPFKRRLTQPCIFKPLSTFDNADGRLIERCNALLANHNWVAVANHVYRLEPPIGKYEDLPGDLNFKNRPAVEASYHVWQRHGQFCDIILDWSKVAPDLKNQGSEIFKALVTAGFDEPNIRKLVSQIEGKSKGVLFAGHKLIGEFYCDLLNDGDATAGLRDRLEKITASIKSMASRNYRLDPGIESDFRQLVSVRQAKLRRLGKNATGTLETLGNLIENESFQTLTAIGALAKVIENEANQDAVKKIAIDLANNLVWQAKSLLWIASQVLDLLLQPVRGIGSNSIIKVIRENSLLLNDLGIEENLEAKIDALEALAQEVGEWADEAKVLSNQDIEITENNLDDLKKFHEDIKDWFFEEQEENKKIDRIQKHKSKVEDLRNQLTACLKIADFGPKALFGFRVLAFSKAKELARRLLPPAFRGLHIPRAYKTLFDGRKRLAGQIPSNFEDLILARFDQAKQDLWKKKIPTASVPPNYLETGYSNENLDVDNDRLFADLKYLELIVGGGEGAGTKKISDQEIAFIRLFADEWSRGKATPLVIADQLISTVTSILKGDVDLDQLFNIRERIESYLLDLIPAKQSFSYGFDVPLPEEIETATLGFFAPSPGCKLNIGAKTTIDLLPNGIPKGGAFKPKITASSLTTLGPFSIKMVGKFFDAVTIKFFGARFESDFDKNSDFKVYYDDFKIGKQLEFIEQLQSWLTPGSGSGAFVQPLQGVPGIEAGYGLGLPAIYIGNLVFFNISLNASAEIPFNDGDSRFKASLGRQSSPFMISYIPYGGSGFFSVTANVRQIIGFEMALDFGAVVPFEIGPLRGFGKIAAGFYIRKYVDDRGYSLTDISATFFAGGSAAIWIFNFAASLLVRLTQKSGGSMEGLAVFTYSFSMGLLDFDFEVRFEKKEKKGFSGNADQSSLNDYRDLQNRGHSRFAQMRRNRLTLVSTGRSVGENHPIDPIIDTEINTMADNWGQYRKYFDSKLKNLSVEDDLW